MKPCCTIRPTHAAGQPAGEPLPVAEWASLTRYERITLLRGTAPAASGSVDLVAEDGSIFWVHLDNGLGRVAVHAEDDAAVWRA